MSRRILNREHVDVTMTSTRGGPFNDVAEIITLGPNKNASGDGTGEIRISFGNDDDSFENTLWDTDQYMRLTHSQATALRDALSRSLAISDG